MQDDLERLRAARLEADRRYNDALTAFDAALQSAHQLRDLPIAPPAPDELALAAIAEKGTIVSAIRLASGGGWLRRRATQFIWGLIGPVFDRQQVYNEAVSAHLHRNVPVHQRTRETLDALIAAVREQRDSLAVMHTRLIEYLQQITPYVDTKDREFAAVAVPHLTEFADRLGRYGESIAVAHQLAMVVKRELDQLQRPSLQSEPGDVGAATRSSPASPSEASVAPPTSAHTLDAYKYVGFEDRFRGPRDRIRHSQAQYLSLFEGSSDVLDVGCGRGEFLDLLTDRGIRARGVDLNHEMAELCRSRGLDVIESDALPYLSSLSEASLGGLFAAQVVEHLSPHTLVSLLDAAYRALRPGALVVLETINPACWLAFFESYIRDITHVRPLHPDTLNYLLNAAGFQDVTVRFSAPVPEHLKLQQIAGDDERVRTLNENSAKINRLLFTFMDYAVIGRRP
jgi:SAM-dependent methyltransferase